MSKPVSFTENLSYSIHSVLNSYAILFFSNSKALAMLLLLVSFFNPIAGLVGLLSVVTSLIICGVIGFDKEQIKTGLYSFNALLLGIGVGTFYELNLAFWILLFVSCLFTVVLSLVLSGWLGKYGLPFLSIPFVISFWLVLLSASEFSHLGLNQKNTSWLSQMYVSNEFPIIKLILDADHWGLPEVVIVFFKSFSAIFFQSNVLTGVIMSFGLLIHSRIAFTLLIIGFLSTYGFNHLVGGSEQTINYYNMGANFMMASIAIGGFFLIPSLRSYLWAILSIPMTYFLVISFGKIFNIWSLPIFSLPFCLAVILLLYFFKLRVFPRKLQLTTLQHYQPELNLYEFINGKERLQNLNYFRLSLPFIGEWTVWQGYDGNITHKGDWSKALDFVITNEDDQTYGKNGINPEHYYCFNKPVLACADGYIEEVADNVEDNEIGIVNTEQNWGNSIVIKHHTGLYTKLSHLKKGSIKPKKGDFVHQGEVIATCGNSGRSPEPHLHFQVQSTPFIGSKTLAYPFAYFLSRKRLEYLSFNSFNIPEQKSLVSPIEVDYQLKQAFAFQPGFRTSFQNSETQNVEHWEVFTDALNQSYIWSEKEKATAYFVNNGTVFYFTAFYGNKKSLLYHFYLAAYKITQCSLPELVSKDVYPLELIRNKLLLYLQDFVAPFFLFAKITYQSSLKEDSKDYQKRIIQSYQFEEYFNKKKQIMSASIMLEAQKIESFTVNIKGKETTAKWILENPY